MAMASKPGRGSSRAETGEAHHEHRGRVGVDDGEISADDGDPGEFCGRLAGAWINNVGAAFIGGRRCHCCWADDIEDHRQLLATGGATDPDSPRDT